MDIHSSFNYQLSPSVYKKNSWNKKYTRTLAYRFVRNRYLFWIFHSFIPLHHEMGQPKYLTGDSAAINEFIDKFDVRYLDLHI